MKNIAKDKPKQMTLKQYMHSTNLRKRAESRSNSRGRSREDSPPSFVIDKTTQQMADLAQLTKSKLIDELKVRLALLISKDEQLVQVLRMLERLIELFNHEINSANKQTQIVTSLIQEKSVLAASTQRDTKIHSTRLCSDQDRLIQQRGRLASAVPGGVSSSQLSANRFPSHRRDVSRSSSEDIPNINLLLMTRLEDVLQGKFKEEQDTKTTFADLMNDKNDNNCKGSPVHVSLDTSFSNEFHQTEQKLKESSISINPNYLHPQFVPARPRLNSTVNVSVHEDLWGHESQRQNNPMVRFQQFKRRSRR